MSSPAMRWILEQQHAKERADREFWDIVRRYDLIEAERLDALEHGLTTGEVEDGNEAVDA